MSPPTDQRSLWARTLLTEAVDQGLDSLPVPLQDVSTFTVTLQPALAVRLKALADQHNTSVSVYAAGLIEAMRQRSESGSISEAPKELPADALPGEGAVREVLRPLLKQAAEKTAAGKIVFAEAATGTGKGRMIASLAAAAAIKGDTVVVSAPLAVTWQLVNDMKDIPEVRRVGLTLSLGRPNFISPQRTLEWAIDNERADLAAWIEGGGRPLSLRSKETSKVISHELCWLLEDALLLAEDLPADSLLLTSEDPAECPAQQLYVAMRSNYTEAGIILCSHFMLAAHTRMMQMRGLGNDEELDDEAPTGLSLPHFIDTLIVDEAHLLEQAFASIYTHTLRLRPLMRTIESLGSRGRKPALDAVKELFTQMQAASARSTSASLNVQLSDVPELIPALKDTVKTLGALPTKGMPQDARSVIRIAMRAANDALSGHSRLRIEVTPVHSYPMLLSGRANLQKALLALWGATGGATLVSATLFTTGDNGSLTRWKLEVPTERAAFLPPVHPAWTTAPVLLHKEFCAHEPDDSPEWATECAQTIQGVASTAQGGTLVLCTSYQNTELLAGRLGAALGDRLIVQSKTSSAATCLAQFKAKHKAGIRPVWLGLGAAWTGIDLSDHSLPDNPELDRLLSDLVITRIPVGQNRSLTHERRTAIGGFRIISQEAAWHFRQGLGRLVRRPGVTHKNLWVLDARIYGGAAWVAPFRQILDRYKKA